MWFNIAMTRDRLSFASVEIDKSYSFTLPRWKNFRHRWSRDQPRPGSLFPTTREAEERDPGNEVGRSQTHVKLSYRCGDFLSVVKNPIRRSILYNELIHLFITFTVDAFLLSQSSLSLSSPLPPSSSDHSQLPSAVRWSLPLEPGTRFTWNQSTPNIKRHCTGSAQMNKETMAKLVKKWEHKSRSTENPVI